MSLAQILEAPDRGVLLLVGPPGAGKSAFCHRVMLDSLALGRPVLYVTTERGAADAIGLLREAGLGERVPPALRFVDAFSQTVGVTAPERPDTIHANCMDLNSISIAITRVQETMGQKGVLLAFDSLTSPYLLSGAEVIRFMRLFLSRFAAEGNSVVALMDAGCGKPEDLVAMMSIADGAIETEADENRRLFRVVKHPRLRPTSIELPVTVRPRVISSCFDAAYTRRQAEFAVRGSEATFRPQVGDRVNIAWRDLIFWSGMLWDPKRFPTMMYELTKYSEDPSHYEFDMFSLFPWHKRLLLRLAFPRSLSKVSDMKRVFDRSFKPQYARLRVGAVEYLDRISRTDEHYFRLHEGYECWGLENVGTALGLMRPAMMAGMFQGMEALGRGLERDWNALETKCVGLGDPYCEFKVVPGEIEDRKALLEKDSETIARVHERLVDRLVGFMLHGQPLIERPNLGGGVHIHEVHHVTAEPLVSERLQTVFRMGGARAGKTLGDRLVDAGLRDEAIGRIVDLMEHCKVGKITVGETIRIEENCERFGMQTVEPSCFFTTGFLNGLFSAVKNQHVREIKCIAAGDPYCEWEIVS